MRKLIIIFIILGLLLGLVIGGLVKTFVYFYQDSEVADSPQEFKLPKVRLDTLSSDSIAFNNIDQPTLLLFWVPQSETCRLQLDILKEIQSEYNLKTIAVGIGRLDKNEIISLKQKKELDFPFVIDKQTKLTEKLEISSVPTLVLYQPEKQPEIIIGFQAKTELDSTIQDYFKN